MKFLRQLINPMQIRALLYKDILVRWRQWWLISIQILWPFVLFILLYTIRLKFASKQYDNCQFPTRQLPTTHNTLPAFLTYICTLENRCSNTEDYNEYLQLEKAPLKPIVDIVQILINDDRMFETLIHLSEKGNFITAIIQLATHRQFHTIRKHIEKVIDLIPEVEKVMNGSFNVKQLFSDRQTFVKAGNLICGHPFPYTETIPLLKEVIESEDFSHINDDELKVMPTAYCKRLYLDITSNNYGKITWNVIKPLIHGKILYAPATDDTRSITKYANSTFEELNRLKLLTVAFTDILNKLRIDDIFIKNFDALIDLVSTEFVRNLIGNNGNIDQIIVALRRLPTGARVYDMVITIKNILECLSIDRFVPLTNAHDLQKTAFNLNKEHLFFAGLYFNQTNTEHIIYTMHMDVENSPPTIENRNRFWFPGPSANMLLDMKYHRGFVQIKEAIDLGIIRHKKEELTRLGLVTQKPPENATINSNFKITIFTNDDEDDNDNDEFENNSTYRIGNESIETSTIEIDETTTMAPYSEPFDIPLEMKNSTESSVVKSRQKRQGFFDAFFGLSLSKKNSVEFEIDNLKFYTKQFPYPAYTRDDFKTGIYLAQAIQAVFFVGLLAEIASSVRHLIWMRESKNSVIMRSMGLRSNSEITAWCIITFCEYLIIFVGVSVILYGGGLLMYTSWLFTMIYLCIFACSIIAFCFMCSTFFNSATIGAVATGVLFFISFCPYIIVLMFDANLTSFENFLVKLSFTTAFAHGWRDIMRMELQEIGLSFATIFQSEVANNDFSYNVFMIILDTLIYICLGYLWQRYKHYEHHFVRVQRERLNDDIGAGLINVSKIYNGNKVAVSNVSLTFQRNQVTCLLGRNGAGKSTILKMLTGQIEPSSGRVIISQCTETFLNDDYFKVGVCSQDNILIPDLTAREHLELYAKIKLTHNFDMEIEDTLKSLNLGKYVNYRASQLSGGYKRRLCVALAFLGSPTVVILDEPCNGVDAKARKDIWDLIERLRKGRAVIFSTHFLDEAEHLSDALVIMKNGKIVANYNADILKNQCTSFHQICVKGCNGQTSEEILAYAHNIFENVHRLDSGNESDILLLHIGCNLQFGQAKEFLKYLHQLQSDGHIKQLIIDSDNIEQIFKNIDQMHDTNHNTKHNFQNDQLKKQNDFHISYETGPLSRYRLMGILFWKRLLHFTRNYRIILSVLILPAIFEICAMWFVIQRREDDYDKSLKLSRNLYKNSVQTLSMEMAHEFTTQIYGGLKDECSQNLWSCNEFKNSKEAFYWLLNTLPVYRERRYGGYTFNDTKAIVWYNNKGYHAMMSWLNDLNSHLLQTEANDSSYHISTFNEPWKLSAAEISTSSILRNTGDAFLAFIFLTAFSLVVSVASVYLVNERVNGEKLQQRLCGVDTITYWIVAFIWDFLVIILAIIVCVIIILIFNIPVFTVRQQLWGLILLSLFYGFACIPIVHVFEKFFKDSSVAIVTIFVLNIFIPLFTISLVVVLGVVGDTPTWDNWRHFLNRAFLIFPQHALGDGFIEMGKNYIVALMFSRFDVDSYKNPINSDLLKPHLIALTLVGLIFLIINVLLEGGHLLKFHKILSKCFLYPFNSQQSTHLEELKIVTIQNSLKRNIEMDDEPALKVEQLCKSYNGKEPVVKNINFAVKAGECFGLLGKNGAGKSTIFRVLSGQVQPDSGLIKYRDSEISYCPQTNIVDRLLTVQECIEFYGRLRRIDNIPKLVSRILESYQLETYRNVLVKNLSGGNRRKLTVATSCCGHTSVVLMDEPTSDMDPVMRDIVYHTIQDLLNENRAIVLTSHSISEIEVICRRIAVLKYGRIFATGTLDNLLEQYGGFYNVTLYANSEKINDIKEEVIKRFKLAKDVQYYTHSIKFSIKVHEASISKQMKSQLDERFKDISKSKSSDTLYLHDLFEQLNTLLEEYDDTIRYGVCCCKLDTIFERILNKNEINGSIQQHSAYEGSSATGYLHKGYVDTEVETEIETVT